MSLQLLGAMCCLSKQAGIASVAGKVGGKVLTPIGVAMDAYDGYDTHGVGGAVGSAAGGFAGFAGGAAGGAALGTMVMPVVGTAIGGIVGGLAGGVGGAEAGKRVLGTSNEPPPEIPRPDWFKNVMGAQESPYTHSEAT